MEARDQQRCASHRRHVVKQIRRNALTNEFPIGSPIAIKPIDFDALEGDLMLFKEALKSLLIADLNSGGPTFAVNDPVNHAVRLALFGRPNNLRSKKK